MRTTSLVHRGVVYACLGALFSAAAVGAFAADPPPDPYAGPTDIDNALPAIGGRSTPPAAAEAMVASVEGQLKIQNYPAARQAALEITQLYPEYLKGWMLLAYCRSLTSDFAGSNEAYDKALQLGAEGSVVYVRKAYNLIRLGDLEGAEAVYRLMLESNDKDTEALSQLAYIEVKLGNYDAAAHYCTRALDITPDDANLVLTLAKIEAKRGGNGNVRELLEKALVLEPRNPEVLEKLSAVYLKEKKYEAAIELLQTLVAIEPDNIKANRSLGVACYQIGDKKDALVAFDKVRDLDGDMADLYGALADCRLAAGDAAGALDVIREGIDKGEQEAWLYSLWGKMLEDSKDYDGAIAKFSEAARFEEEPWSDYAKKQIARQSQLKKRDRIMASQLQE